MAELKLISTHAAPPAPRGFVETETARAILTTLRRAQHSPGETIGLIAGAPGVGKSEAVRQFLTENPHVSLHRATAAEGGAWNTAVALSRLLDMDAPNARDMETTRLRIANEIGAGGMLIIDEAHNLVDRNTRGADNWNCPEWLRMMSEDGMFSLVLCGGLELREIETRLPGLWRRMRRTIVPRVPKSDVAAVAASWGLFDPKMTDLLFGASRKQGGALGDVVTACRETRLLSGNRRTTTFSPR